jgi:hypothetical protein
MYVLFRLDRIEGVVPVVDEHARASTIYVEVSFNGQTQSTDGYAVPSRSQRLTVEARTQLLWTAQAEGAPGRELELVLYQGWPGARQAHPLRECLGRCTLALPAERDAAGHGAADVKRALEISTHPLSSVAQW